MKRITYVVTVIVILLAMFIGYNAVAQQLGRGRSPKLIIMPGDGFAPLRSLIADAARSIDLVMYRLDDKATINVLKSAAVRGVKVRVMLEKHPDEGAEANRATESELKSARIHTKWTNPEFKQTMERAVVVDRSVAAVATFDLIAENEKGCRGFATTLRDPRDISDILWMYEADWTRVSAKPLNSNMTWNEGGTRTRLLQLIRNAHKEIRIYANRIRNAEAASTLIEALGRGVNVRIIAGTESGKEDSSLTKMRMAGAKIRRLKGMSLSANIVIADDGSRGEIALLGAGHISTEAHKKMRTLGIIISDSERLSLLEKTFDADWRRSSLSPPG